MSRRCSFLRARGRGSGARCRSDGGGVRCGAGVVRALSAWPVSSPRVVVRDRAPQAGEQSPAPAGRFRIVRGGSWVWRLWLWRMQGPRTDRASHRTQRMSQSGGTRGLTGRPARGGPRTVQLSGRRVREGVRQAGAPRCSESVARKRVSRRSSAGRDPQARRGEHMTVLPQGERELLDAHERF